MNNAKKAVREKASSLKREAAQAMTVSQQAFQTHIHEAQLEAERFCRQLNEQIMVEQINQMQMNQMQQQAVQQHINQVNQQAIQQHIDWSMQSAQNAAMNANSMMMFGMPMF